MQVDLDPAALGRVYPATVPVVGDVAAFLRAVLADAELGNVDPEWTARAEQTREQVRATQRKGLGDHAALCDAVRAVLPDDAVVARDVTIASSAWGNRLLPMYDPRSNVFPRGGGIGQGLGMAIGAALADEGGGSGSDQRTPPDPRAGRRRRPRRALRRAAHHGAGEAVAGAARAQRRRLRRAAEHAARCGSREYAVDLLTPDFANAGGRDRRRPPRIGGAAEAEPSSPTPWPCEAR